MELLGSLNVSYLQVAAHVGGNPVKSGQLRPVVAKVRRRHRKMRRGRRLFEETHEAVRMWVGKRGDEDALNRAEDCGVRPDCERQREDGGDRKAR